MMMWIAKNKLVGKAGINGLILFCPRPLQETGKGHDIVAPKSHHRVQMQPAPLPTRFHAATVL
jgi:hypothetical protein